MKINEKKQTKKERNSFISYVGAAEGHEPRRVHADHEGRGASLISSFISSSISSFIGSSLLIISSTCSLDSSSTIFDSNNQQSPYGQLSKFHVCFCGLDWQSEI